MVPLSVRGLVIACALLPLPSLLGAQATVPDPFDLDARVEIAVERLTDPAQVPAFTLPFVLADVKPQRGDPRRFYNFSGDLSGRYLEVMALAPPATRARAGFPLTELVDSLLTYQRPDGRFGDASLAFTAEEIGGEHMALLWGNGRLLVGLMTYYEQTGDTAVLAAARRLGDFFISTAEVARQPATLTKLEGFGAKGIICFTQYIEGLVTLARATDDPRYTAAAVAAYTVLPERGEQHTHGYLSTLRGVLDLYALTGDAAHLDYVRATVDDLLASDDYTLYGAVFEYFGGHGERDEGCSSADFTRLALHLGQLTGEERYREVGERALVNALLFNQYPNGDFGHHFFDAGAIEPSNPRRAWWCCTMHGLRALQAVQADYTLVPTDDGALELRLLVPQSLAAPGFRGSLAQQPDAGGRVAYTLTVDSTDGTPLHVRLPGWATGWALAPGAAAPPARVDGARLTVGAPTPGMTVRFGATPTVAFHPVGDDAGASEHAHESQAPATEAAATFPAQPEAGYLTYGPWVLGARDEAFAAEPDWVNQVSLAELAPGAHGITLGTRYFHGGYPGTHDVTLYPLASQMAAGHPYMRVVTGFGRELAPRSPDE